MKGGDRLSNDKTMTYEMINTHLYTMHIHILQPLCFRGYVGFKKGAQPMIYAMTYDGSCGKLEGFC